MERARIQAAQTMLFLLFSTQPNATEIQDHFHSILPHLKSRDHKEGQYRNRVSWFKPTVTAEPRTQGHETAKQRLENDSHLCHSTTIASHTMRLHEGSFNVCAG